MLAAEFPLAVAPAARRDHRRDPLVDPAGVDRDRGQPKLEPIAPMRSGSTFGCLARKESASLVACTWSLQISRPFSPFARAAQPGMSKRRRDIAELLEHGAGLEHVLLEFWLPPTVQDHEGRPALMLPDAVRHPHVPASFNPFDVS
jgi:hypothetical protein